jgi:hypothetical protein
VNAQRARARAQFVQPARSLFSVLAKQQNEPGEIELVTINIKYSLADLSN